MAVPISARKDGANIIHSTGPDVCLTPIGGRDVPVPYMSLVNLSQSVRTSKSVRNNDSLDFQLNSRANMVTGHEPGTSKGVAFPGYRAYAHAKTAAPDVFSEGWAVVRDSDPAWINHPDVQPVEPRRVKSRKPVPHV